MKGVILAGGTGERLSPLTDVVNKHLLPVGRYPMIYYGLDTMLEAGIKQIAVVTGQRDIEDVSKLLGDGEQWGLEITYRIQQKPKGIAHALSLTSEFVGKDQVFVLLGDNLFGISFKKHVKKFSNRSQGAEVFLTTTDSPEKYAVANPGDSEIEQITEKPNNPSSNRIVTGAYLYNPDVFDVIDEIKPSTRGEFEITSVNNHYVERSQLTYTQFEDWWFDTGTFISYMEAFRHLRDNRLRHLEAHNN